MGPMRDAAYRAFLIYTRRMEGIDIAAETERVARLQAIEGDESPDEYARLVAESDATRAVAREAKDAAVAAIVLGSMAFVFAVAALVF